jgi:hypothetical protein
MIWGVKAGEWKIMQPPPAWNAPLIHAATEASRTLRWDIAMAIGFRKRGMQYSKPFCIKLFLYNDTLGTVRLVVQPIPYLLN